MATNWETLNQQTLRHMEEGDIDKALAAAAKALANARAQGAEGRPQLAVSLNNIGEINRLNGNTEQAERALREAIEVSEAVHGSQSLEVGDILFNLIELLLEQERYGDAEQPAIQLVAIFEKSGDDPQLLLSAYMVASTVHFALGNLTAAKEQLEKCLSLLAATGETTDPGQAAIYQKLGLIARQQERFDEAERYLRQGVALLERSIGPEHAEFGGMLQSLAELYLVQGLLPAAEPLLTQAVAIFRQTLPDDSTQTGAALDRLAAVALAKGEKDKAHKLLLEVESIYQASLGNNHPGLAEVYNSLAELYLSDKKVDKAIDPIEKSLTIRRKAFGEMHPAVAQSLNNLALIHAQQGSVALALKLHNQALTIRKKVFGEHHPAITQSLENLAAVHRSQGKFSEAALLLQEALAIWQKTEGGDHPATAQCYHNLGTLYVESGEYTQAEQALLAAKKILQQRPGNEAHLAVVFETMAGLYHRQGKTRESSEYAARAHKIRRPEKPTPH